MVVKDFQGPFNRCLWFCLDLLLIVIFCEFDLLGFITMGFTTIWVRICLEPFPSIQQANLRYFWFWEQGDR